MKSKLRNMPVGFTCLTAFWSCACGWIAGFMLGQELILVAMRKGLIQ